MPTRVILVRHAQTQWNLVERFRGRADIPLDQIGIQQAKITGQRIANNWKPAAVYSSPLLRSMQTAQIIAETLQHKANSVDGLIDIDYGEWQGLTPDEVASKWPEYLQNWYNHPESVQIPGGECLAEVRTRAMTCLGKICQSHDNQEVVLVSHTVVNRLILLGVLGVGDDQFWHVAQEPCAINQIEMSEKGYMLVFFNDTCHLK